MSSGWLTRDTSKIWGAEMLRMRAEKDAGLWQEGWWRTISTTEVDCHAYKHATDAYDRLSLH